MRQQAYWFARAGVDALGIDWTNNLWSTPSWAARAPNVQEIVNATSLFYGVLGDLASTRQWDVPQQMLILGLDNGPEAPLAAIYEELDFMAAAYIGNDTLPQSMWMQYLGKPLVTIFDGRGLNHSDISHGNWTIRWMASQNQETGFNLEGYWSWMDGSASPPVTPFQGTNEAATITPAFFAGGGWLAPSASGHRDGLTFMQTFTSVVETAGVRQASQGQGQGQPFVPAISHILVSQWQEYAGQANGGGYGPNHTVYVDAYSAELSNELEPTGTTACAYRRPGVACGGWGMRYLNLLSMVIDACQDVAALDMALMVSILQPALGDWSNYTDAANSTIALAWAINGFNSTALLTGGSWMQGRSLPVEVRVDGAVVATVPAGTTQTTLNVTALQLDRRYPHSITVTAVAPSPGSLDHLTQYPLSLNVFDELAPLPLDQAVPASSERILHLWPVSG